jgi:hypothetical protein
MDGHQRFFDFGDAAHDNNILLLLHATHGLYFGNDFTAGAGYAITDVSDPQASPGALSAN